MKIGIIIFVICLGFLLLAIFKTRACADDGTTCFVSPIPTGDIVMSPAASISPSCTPTPDIQPSTAPLSSIPSTIPNTDIPPTAIPATGSPTAGQSAVVLQPTSAPDTGRAE